MSGVSRIVRAGAVALVLCLALVGFREVEPMVIKDRKEWVTSEWTRPGVELYRQAGDFAELSGLLVDRTGRELMRSPGWSAQVNTPANFAPVPLGGSFYDGPNQRWVLIGTDATNIVSCLFNQSWVLTDVNYTLVASKTNLGGLVLQNIVYFGGNLYVIDSAGDVHRGASYTAGLASFYASSDAQVLAVVGDRVYMASTAGVIYRLNDGDTAFEAYLTPTVAMNIRYMAAFRGYLLVAAARGDGGLSLYRVSLPTATQLQEVARVPGIVDFFSAVRVEAPYVVHNDKFYALTGRYDNPDGTDFVDAWEWNGSQLRRISQISGADVAYISVGLLSWKHHLLFYASQSEVASASHMVKMLIGNGFVDFLPLTSTTVYYHVNALASDVLFLTKTGDNYGVVHAGEATLMDGYLVTSSFDAGSPFREKLLNSITVLLDGKTTSFKIPVKYRVNDNTGWTLATTGDGNRRVSIGGLGVSFYNLQLRIDLDDDTGANTDHRILAVSVMYSMQE